MEALVTLLKGESNYAGKVMMTLSVEAVAMTLEVYYDITIAL